jgi:hypothetical protein
MSTRKCSRFLDYQGIKLDLGNFDMCNEPELPGIFQVQLESCPNYLFLIDSNLCIVGHGLKVIHPETIKEIKKLRSELAFVYDENLYTFEKKGPFLMRIPKDIPFKKHRLGKQKDESITLVYLFVRFMKMSLMKDIVSIIFNTFYDVLRLDFKSYHNVCTLR